MNRVTLFVFPHAGGNKYAYNIFKPYFSESCQVETFEFPGRGTRIQEPLIKDIYELVDNFYPFIEGRLNLPYAFYGHSLGSLLAYLLTKKILANNKRPPLHLFLSGRRGPFYYQDTFVERSKLPKPEFFKILENLGGIPTEIINDAASMEFFEPILRADFEALEKYRHFPSEKLSIPLTVLLGKQDKATYDEAVLWEQETTSSTDIHYFEGRHFFIFDNVKDIAALISRKLAVENK